MDSYTATGIAEGFIEADSEDQLIEANKAIYNAMDGKANWNGEWHLVASIPEALYISLLCHSIGDIILYYEVVKVEAVAADGVPVHSSVVATAVVVYPPAPNAAV